MTNSERNKDRRRTPPPAVQRPVMSRGRHGGKQLQDGTPDGATASSARTKKRKKLTLPPADPERVAAMVHAAQQASAELEAKTAKPESAPGAAPAEKHEASYIPEPDPRRPVALRLLERVKQSHGRIYQLADDLQYRAESIVSNYEFELGHLLHKMPECPTPGFFDWIDDSEFPFTCYLLDVAIGETPSDELRKEALYTLVNDFVLLTFLFGDELPGDLVADASSCIAKRNYADSRGGTVLDNWQVYVSRLKAGACRRSTAGIVLGLPKVDEQLFGLEGVTVLGGDRGSGKSSLALQAICASLAADPKLAALFVSFDMPAERQFHRLTCRMSGVSYRELVTYPLAPHVLEKLATLDHPAENDIRERLRIIDQRAWDDEMDIVDNLLSLRGELLDASGAQQVLDVVDLYGQLANPCDDPGSTETEQRRLQAIRDYRLATRGLRRPGGDSMVLISEIRKSSAARAELTSDDLLGTGSLISLADTVLMLSQAEESAANGKQPLTLAITKGRDGAERGRHAVVFDYLHYQFYDASAATRPKSNALSSGVNATAKGRPRK